MAAKKKAAKTNQSQGKEDCCQKGCEQEKNDREKESH